MKLIDLDTSASLSTGFSGAKSSSAYVPPELVHKSTDNKLSIKNYSYDSVTHLPITEGLPYELVPARFSHDSWALVIIVINL